MSHLVRKDVTAVKLFKTYILAGIGSYANIFDKQTSKRLQRLLVLSSTNIYGFVISKCGEQVLVFGKKQFTILKLVEDDGVVFKLVLGIITCPDWIQSAVWIDDNNIALLTSHNTVVHYNINTGTLIMHQCQDYSVLYSGLLLPVSNRLMILAGTVFSEIIIRWFMDTKVMHRLVGHRGVIFSISCDPHKGIIVSTSDDRSLRIWEMLNPKNSPPDSVEFWQNITIECKAEVYGHNARVLRNVIINDLVISGGEDASICYWKDGKLLRKVAAHQMAPIWAMDSDGQHLLTGGGDGAVILHPLTVATEYGDKKLLQIDGTIKVVRFTARRNIVLLSTSGDLIYYDVATKFKMVYKLIHESTFKMMALSSCRQIIAVADMCGKLNVFLEVCKGGALIRNVFDTKLDIGEICSMHFAGNRHLVLCAEEGEITVMTASGSEVAAYAKFILPPCKERWLTACTIDPKNEMIIVADRNSAVHCFLKGWQYPVKTFTKVHGRYGSTSLTVRDNTLLSTGRDGSIKYFAIDRRHLVQSKYLTGRELEFDWVEKFLDKNENLVCGFQEKTFILYNIKSNCKVIQTVCGGGHRSHDIIRYLQKVNGELEELVLLVYLKSSFIYLVDYQLSLIASKPIVISSHSKGINSLKVFRMNKSPVWFYVSGGEDTTLRVSTIDGNFDFEDQLIYKHLSNIRTVKVVPFGDKLLVLSAGGRAQVSVNEITVTWSSDNKPKLISEQLAFLMLKGSDEERRRNKRLSSQQIDFDPETRMMDLDVIAYDINKYFVFIGCSDGALRIFTLKTDSDSDSDSGSDNVRLKYLRAVKHYDSCILKVVCMELFANIHVVATCMTTGQVIIWNIVNDEEDFDVIPSFPNKYHNAGVNCIDFKVITDDLLLLATGGDDNRVALTLLEVRAMDQANLLMTTKVRWFSDSFHSSQVNGVVFFGDNLLVTASIDQRVTVLKWAVSRSTIECSYVHQICTDISDIQGMVVLECERCEWSQVAQSVSVCVYGRGFEVLTIDIPPH